MGLSRQEYWSELPGPPPGDLPNPGIQPASLKSPALAGGFFTTIATWEAPQVDLLRSTQCTVVGAATAGSVISTEVYMHSITGSLSHENQQDSVLRRHFKHT